MSRFIKYSPILFILIFIISCKRVSNKINEIKLEKHNCIALIGNNLCSRLINYDYLETYIHTTFPEKKLILRNMCDGGDTPGFRPHSGRNTPWAFAGAEKFQTEFANNSNSEGHLQYPDEWLSMVKADIIFAFFGYNEAFEMIDSTDKIKAELVAFINHTKAQKYNGKSAPQLVLVSPIAFEDLSSKYDLPNGRDENKRLNIYTQLMAEVANEHEVGFINLFDESKKWYSRNDEDLTIDGFQLNDSGYQLLGEYLLESAFKIKVKKEMADKVKKAVDEKNWSWHNLYKIPNGVHVFGRRYNPFGQDNYPFELKKLNEMTIIGDSLIWSVANKENYDSNAAYSQTTKIPDIQTNYKPINGKYPSYLYGDDALKTFTMADGYKVELFASEKEFPDLANPVQLSFDNKGRLWVAVMPTYPHYKPGDEKPNDKLLILEDTNNDGKADKQIVFADKLHLPIGFEFAPEGVYVSQGTNLKLLMDTNGDDKADKEEIILSGFDDHDTHHAISAFCADPSGAIFMAEGVFLHTNVETPYGPVRATNGGFFRYAPQRKHLERVAQLSIPNPWGIAFDDWGQNIFAETSGPDVRWMMPGSHKPVYGISNPASPSLIEEAHKVRPTSGLEFVSSRHFPDEVQGDLLINNNIGFLGMKQHSVKDDTTGFIYKFRQDLIKSNDGNFRPVDMEFAPDGSLYLVDWHNILIGHMQHNARDPLRDHVHGRIYRITYPSRPLVKPAKIHNATIEELLDNLKLPEYRTRYRAKRELRGRNHNDVLKALNKWVDKLDKNDKNYEHNLLEALWVTWGLNKVDKELLTTLLNAKDFRARAAAVRVLRYTGHQVKDQISLLKKAASDTHNRVRLEAIVAASWLNKNDAMDILNIAGKHPLDRWMKSNYEAIIKNFETRIKPETSENVNDIVSGLKGKDLEMFRKGRVLYAKEGNCATCHQLDGRGLAASNFPPLANSEWVNGDEERLIKITLNGLMGPLRVNGKLYDGKVPMVGYAKLMSDEEIAAVLTFVRKSFGNNKPPVLPETVKRIREKTKQKTGYYLANEL